MSDLIRPKKKTLKCASFYYVKHVTMVPKEGVSIIKGHTSLWKDGRYLGIITKLVIFDDELAKQGMPDLGGHNAIEMPEREYEFQYNERTS